MTRAAALLLLLLPGCERIDAASNKATWAEVKADTNAHSIRALESRIAGLEELREKDRAMAETQNNLLRLLSDEVKRLGGNDTAFHAQIDYLRAHHGQGPMSTK